MKTKCFILISALLACFGGNSFGQTGVAIAQPDFSTQTSAWTLNGNASIGTVGSAKALILTPSTGSQSGSGFWNQQITLGSNASFSVFFSFVIDQNTSRADGLTFTLQQSTSAALGSGGGTMGLTGISGTSLSVEFDTYMNGGYDVDNNHIAIDLNGNTSHSPGTGLLQSISTSTLDLADAKTKYVWIDYNGATNLFEVRISYSTTRPTTATLSTTSYNLSTMFASKNMYMGFTAGTGGAWERHSITSFYATNQYAPITPATTTYVQSPVKITMTSASTSVADNGTSLLPITITLYDGGGAVLAGQPVTVAITSGTGLLSIASGTTNSSGQLVVNLSTTKAGNINVLSTAGFGGLTTSSTFSGTTTLALTMDALTAAKTDAGVTLSWDMLSVDGGRDIEILRSSDGVQFDSIGVENINEQTSFLGRNSFNDVSPASGKNFYKLRLSNIDGITSFSNVVWVNTGETVPAVKILGNPLTTDLRLSGVAGAQSRITIYDMSGRAMNGAQADGHSETTTVSCSNLRPGQYFVKIDKGGQSQTLSFIKE